MLEEILRVPKFCPCIAYLFRERAPAGTTEPLKLGRKVVNDSYCLRYGPPGVDTFNSYTRDSHLLDDRICNSYCFDGYIRNVNDYGCIRCNKVPQIQLAHKVERAKFGAEFGD